MTEVRHDIEPPGEQQAEPKAAAESIAVALSSSRVDLLELIAKGIPPRQFVAGTGGALVKAKRHHIVAPAKAGKTFAIAILGGLDIVRAGGTVVVLDRENGAEEVARRLGSVLDTWHADAKLRELVRNNFRYHAWPQLKLEWGAHPDYAREFADADVVIFDSSRKFLTSVGLKEDASDDFSRFTDALIDPLMLAGIATIILDNSGHSDEGRARGTSSKADLCDVMFALRTVEKFSASRRGSVELTCTHSRLGELDGKWRLELGGGVYGSWTHLTGADARQAFHDACVKALINGPQGRDDLIAAARQHGATGKSDTLRSWLFDLVADDASPIHHDSRGYSLDPPSGSGLTPGPLRGTGVRSPDPPLTQGDPADGVRFPCSCVDSAECDDDGRCSRCQGWRT